MKEFMVRLINVIQTILLLIFAAAIILEPKSSLFFLTLTIPTILIRPVFFYLFKLEGNPFLPNFLISTFLISTSRKAIFTDGKTQKLVGEIRLAILKIAMFHYRNQDDLLNFKEKSEQGLEIQKELGIQNMDISVACVFYLFLPILKDAKQAHLLAQSTINQASKLSEKYYQPDAESSKEINEIFKSLTKCKFAIMHALNIYFNTKATYADIQIINRIFEEDKITELFAYIYSPEQKSDAA